jgi:hypothetical protein
MNLNAKTWQSAISSVGLVVGGALAWAGVVSQSSVTNIVQQAVDAAPGVISTVSALMTLGLTVYKAFQHTDPQIVKEASLVQGVAEPIKITLDAPPALRALAHDDSVPTVKPVISDWAPSTTAQRQ